MRWKRSRSKKASVSTAPAFAVGSTSTRATCSSIPDPDTAFVDPFTKETTLSLICNIFDPITKERYPRDPRGIANKAEAYVKSTGLATDIYFGPEAEFFIFDGVRVDVQPQHSFFYIDSAEGAWNSGRDEQPNLGYKLRFKEGYFPVPPADSLQDIRTEMMLEIMKLGIEVEAQHHEVATAGQSEIDLKFDTLVRMADRLMTYKYVIRNVAKRNGKTVTFMPKPHLRRQRLRHALSPEFVEGQDAALRGQQVRGLERHGAALHRRIA